ncbi:MAG: hypothetical protein EXQ85_08745 [Alphaproteobacteria bacterium]|nr:hypothetical protein [Alphaproteobacteria bacterium]
MRAFALVAAFVLVVMLPFGAAAQQRAPGPQPQPQLQDAIQGVTAGKILAIGVGVIVGAVVLDALLAANAAPLVGGIVGGFAGAWWYNNSGDSTPRVNIRQPTHVAVALRQAPLDRTF